MLYADLQLAMAAVLFLALAVIVWLYVLPDHRQK